MEFPVPYMRGDEPCFTRTRIAGNQPFPTCVGMNPMMMISIVLILTVPYMRGDEPREIKLNHLRMSRSLHAWG